MGERTIGQGLGDRPSGGSAIIVVMPGWTHRRQRPRPYWTWDSIQLTSTVACYGVLRQAPVPGQQLDSVRLLHSRVLHQVMLPGPAMPE